MPGKIWKSLRKLGRCIFEAWYSAIIRHDGVEHAGYLSFLGLLALFPFLVLIVVFAGWLGEGELGTQFVELLFSHMPPEAIAAVKPRIEEISSGPPSGLLTISILGAIWTSSSLVEGMRTVLNRAYRVSTPPAYIFRRVTSILQLLVFTLVIIIGMFLLVFAPLVIGQLEEMVGLDFLAQEQLDLGNLIFSFSTVSMFLMVANLYYILPNIRQTIIDVVPGAIITVSLWTTSAALFSYYLSTFDQMSLIYGSLGGIIATLIFFYMVNVIFIYGAELNYQLVTAFGVKIEEKEHFDPPPPPSE